MKNVFYYTYNFCNRRSSLKRQASKKGEKEDSIFLPRNGYKIQIRHET